MASLEVAPELAERCFVQLKQDIAQLLGFRVAGTEAFSIDLAQCADLGVAVLVADLAIVIAMAIVETRLAHGVLPRAGIMFSLAGHAAGGHNHYK
jgi:hypothetical protein